MQSNSDTVNVRLSAAGQAAAKGGTLSVHGGAMTLTFTGSQVQPVHRAIWFQTLAPTAPFGQPWFELAPAAAAVAVPASVASKPAAPIPVLLPKSVDTSAATTSAPAK